VISRFKNVFVLAPHTDDGEFGAGGTIARLIEAGANVFYLAFSTAEASVPDGFAKDILKTEVMDATTILGIPKDNVRIFNYEVRKLNFVRQEILENLILMRKEITPDLVLIPSLHDIHQDHATVAQEGLRAFKNTTILGYELIWNNLTFDTTSFVALEEHHVNTKIRALEAYRSQFGKNYLSKEFILSLAKVRGVQSNFNYAESFEVVRLMIK
jgi:N-acetylglucosamine malate deacetylase 1